MIAVAVAVIIGVVAVTCGIVADSNHPDSLAFLGVMVRTTAAQIFLAGAICTWALFAALWLLSAGIHRSRERGIELRALRAAAAGLDLDDVDDVDDLDDLDLAADAGSDRDLHLADRKEHAGRSDPRLDRDRAGSGAGTGAAPWTGTAPGAETAPWTGADVAHGYGYEQPETSDGRPANEGRDGRPDSNWDSDWNWDWHGNGDWDGRPNSNPNPNPNPDPHSGPIPNLIPNPDLDSHSDPNLSPNPDSPSDSNLSPNPDSPSDPNPDSPRNRHGQAGTSPDWREDGNWAWDGHPDPDTSQRWRWHGDAVEGAHADGRRPGHGTDSWENADWPNRAASVVQTPSPDAGGPTGSSYLAVPIRSEPDVLGSPNTPPGNGFASYAFPGFDSYRSSAFATSPVSDQTTSDSIPPTSACPESGHPASHFSGPVRPDSNSGRSGSGSVGTGFSDGTSPAAGLDGVDPRRVRKPVSE